MDPETRQYTLDMIAGYLDYHDVALTGLRRSRRASSIPAAWDAFIDAHEAVIDALQLAYRHAEEAK